MTAFVLGLCLQEGAEVARGGKAEPQNLRVFCTIDQFVELARLEAGRIAKLGVARSGRLAGLARSERPLGIRDGDARLVLAHTQRKRRQEAVGERRLVVGVDSRIGLAGGREPAALQRKRRGRTGHHQFVADDACDRRSVGIFCNRDLHRHAVVTESYVRLPAEPDDGVALLLHEAVAGFRQRIMLPVLAGPPGMSALISERPPLLPRLMMLKNSTPFDLVRSAGRKMSMSVEYSTMPFAFFGASAMSWIMAFEGSVGSTSP